MSIRERLDKDGELIRDLLLYIEKSDNPFLQTMGDLKEYEYLGFTHAMVFMHQQNAAFSREALVHTSYYAQFINAFDTVNMKSPVLYRGDIFPKDSTIQHQRGEVESYHWGGSRAFSSFTTDYDVACRFAKTKAERSRGESSPYVLKAIPCIYLDCEPYGVVDDEKEFLVHSYHVLDYEMIHAPVDEIGLITIDK